jgi:hypothetical protein
MALLIEMVVDLGVILNAGCSTGCADWKRSETSALFANRQRRSRASTPCS